MTFNLQYAPTLICMLCKLEKTYTKMDHALNDYRNQLQMEFYQNDDMNVKPKNGHNSKKY